eukprot:COSAG01_NODE_10606_length_2122_cov_1110.873950_4_plen_83_part_00
MKYGAKVEQIRRTLEETARRLDPALVVRICGSFRRQQPSSGDIDCLLTHPRYHRPSGSEAQGGGAAAAASRYNMLGALVRAS